MNYITPISNPSFAPPMCQILSITNANPAVVTTTIDGVNPAPNIYISGLIGRLYIPYGCGMPQANQLEGVITILSPETFSIDIDTTQFWPFIAPPPITLPLQAGDITTPPQIVIVGEITSILYGAVQNILPPAV